VTNKPCYSHWIAGPLARPARYTFSDRDCLSGTSSLATIFYPYPEPTPSWLRRGDRVAAVTPCWGGPAVFPARYEAGKRALAELFGLEIVETAHALSEPGWLYAHPEARAADLMTAFSDTSVKAIIATIGGDDAIRLIPHLDLGIIRDNPKIFVGYSDPTAIHFACLKAGVTSLHGPTIMSGFAENAGMSRLSAETFRKVAFEARLPGEMPLDAEGWTVEHLSWGDPANQDKPRRRTASAGPEILRGSGRARGRLIGGCAEVLEMLKGSPWWPPQVYWNGAILFYETSEEAPSETLVLRWLRNFAAQGILARIIHRTARNRPRPPNTWARDFIAKNFIKQPIRIVVNDINGLALTAHFS